MISTFKYTFGFFLLGTLAGFGAETGTLRVGAARVDITPAEDAALPMSGYAGRKSGFTKIHDRINARAIVLDDGTNRAAILAWELIGVPNPVWSDLSARIAKETGIPAQNLLIAGVHSHSAPTLRGGYGQSSSKTAEYTDKVMNAAVEVVRKANSSLQPARVGAGTGLAYLNMNRREINPETGRMAIGRNPTGSHDRTVAVVRFDDMDGNPIALFINYPVHAVIMGQENLELSGDFAGATSRFVEHFYNNGGQYPTGGRPRSDAGYLVQPDRAKSAPGREVVAIWTSGAAGDLNALGLARGSDFTLVEASGQILGEEVIRVAGTIQTASQARIGAVQKVVTCPGKRTVRSGDTVTFQDADPVDIRLSLLTINDIALAGVSGEVLNMIGQRLKRESRMGTTIMVTHTNGSSGYIPDDAAYEHIGYEISTTRLKKGCAEAAVVNGFLEMMGKRR